MRAWWNRPASGHVVSWIDTRSGVGPGGEDGHVRDGDGGGGGPGGRRRRGRPGAKRHERAHRLVGGVRRGCWCWSRRLGEEHGQAAAAVGAALPGVAEAGDERRRAGHGHVLRGGCAVVDVVVVVSAVAVAVAAIRGGDHQVVQHGEGLAGEHVVVVVVVVSIPRRGTSGLQRSRRGHLDPRLAGAGAVVATGASGSGSSSLLHQGGRRRRGRDAAAVAGVGAGDDGSRVVVLPAAREVARQQRVAGHDLVDVVARDVEVGDGVEPPELDRRDVVRLRRLLLRACTVVVVRLESVRASGRRRLPCMSCHNTCIPSTTSQLRQATSAHGCMVHGGMI